MKNSKEFLIKNSKEFVMFRLSSLGDVVLSTGVLLFWYRKYGVKFHVITKSAFAPVFENNPAVSSVEILDKKDLKGSAYKKKCVELAQKYKDITLVDLHGNMRAKILARVWQGDVLHYNKMSVWRRLFLWTGGRIGKEKLLATNVVQRYALTLEVPMKGSMEDSVEDSIPNERNLSAKIFLSEQEKAIACKQKRELFGTSGPAGHVEPIAYVEPIEHVDCASLEKTIIALHPFATHETKSWRMERWISVAEKLDRQGYQILWLGLGDMPETFVGKSLVNKTSLRELCAILSVCDLLLTGDSGPMHLAQAVGTPLVAIFGPTCKEWGFYPFGEKVQILKLDINCCPCSLHGSRKCSHIKCLNGISDDMIFDTIKSSFAS